MLKINKILETSKRVLYDVALPNGAIVAANTDHEYYPRTAKDYRYVWPRDAAYVCVALDYLENANECEMGRLYANPPIKGEGKTSPNLSLSRRGTESCIQERYFDWLTERPEDFKKEGLLWQNYSTNGRKESCQFQPDQMGTTLWAIWHHFKDNLSGAYKYETLIRRIADGICSQWKGSYFFKNTSDLWEDGKRKTSTRIENNFTYTLAACASGLEKALLIFPNNLNWEKASGEMRKKIDQSYDKKNKYFYRNYGKISDRNMDASLLGLVWPFEIVRADDIRMRNTVKKMEEKVVIYGGVHRFEMDYYDGEGTGYEGAGAWPLLNFWIAIYWAIAGDKKKAKKYFDWVINRMDDEFIPEQIYDDFRDGQGIKPLAWSHAMFIVAFYKLYNLKS
ncbi:MAG: glycoside hydrolase family 15 protein [bacterium]